MMLPPGPWTKGIDEPAIQMPGLNWESLAYIDNAPDRFDATEAGAYDVGENGVRRLIVDMERGAPANGLPVFFGREHMQRNILVRDGGSVSHPKDLEGQSIGSRLPAFSATGAGVMLVLEQAYGAALESIRWHMADGVLPGSRMNLDLNPGWETDEQNIEKLLQGVIDAVIVTTGPRYWSLLGGDEVDQIVREHPGIRALLNDPEVIADAYKRSGLYVISDVTVIRPELASEHPALADQLVALFARADELAPNYRNADEELMAQREIELLGTDPHRYGLDDDARDNLERFIDILFRLGAIESRMPPQSLFV